MNILKFNHPEQTEFKHFLNINTSYLKQVTTSCGCSTSNFKKDGLEVIIAANSIPLVKNSVPSLIYENKKTYQKNVTITVWYINEEAPTLYQFQLTIHEKNMNNDNKIT